MNGSTIPASVTSRNGLTGAAHSSSTPSTRLALRVHPSEGCGKEFRKQFTLHETGSTPSEPVQGNTGMGDSPREEYECPDQAPVSSAGSSRKLQYAGSWPGRKLERWRPSSRGGPSCCTTGGTGTSRAGLTRWCRPGGC